jgi:hypothetical protein
MIRSNININATVFKATKQNLRTRGIKLKEAEQYLEITHSDLQSGENKSLCIPLPTYEEAKKLRFQSDKISNFISNRNVHDKEHSIVLLSGSGQSYETSVIVHIKTAAGDLHFELWPNGNITLVKGLAGVGLNIETHNNVLIKDDIELSSLNINAHNITQKAKLHVSDVSLTAEDKLLCESEIRSDTLSVKNTGRVIFDEKAKVVVSQELEMTSCESVINATSVTAGKIKFNGAHLTNMPGAKIEAQDLLQVKAQTIENESILSSVHNDVDLQATTKIHTHDLATISARGDIKIAAPDIITQGKLKSLADVSLHGQTIIQDAKIDSNTLTSQASQRFENLRQIGVQQFKLTDTPEFHNHHHAQIDAIQGLTITGSSKIKNEGALEGALVDLTATESFHNTVTGRVLADSQVKVSSGQHGINDGLIESKKITSQGQVFENTETGKLKSELKGSYEYDKFIQSGKITSFSSSVDIIATQEIVTNENSSIEANKEITFDAPKLSLKGKAKAQKNIKVKTHQDLVLQPSAQLSAKEIDLQTMKGIINHGEIGFEGDDKTSQVKLNGAFVENSNLIKAGEIEFNLHNKKTGDIKNNSNGQIIILAKPETKIACRRASNQGKISAPGLDMEGSEIDNEDGEISVENNLKLKGHTKNYRGRLKGKNIDIESGKEFDNRFGKTWAQKKLALKTNGKVKSQGGQLCGDENVLIAPLAKPIGEKAVSDIRVECTHGAGIYSQEGTLTVDAKEIIVDDDSLFKGKLETELFATKVYAASPIVSKKITAEADSLTIVRGIAAEDDLALTQREEQLTLYDRIQAKNAKLKAPEIQNKALLQIKNNLDIETSSSAGPYSFINQKNINGRAKIFFKGEGFSHAEGEIQALSLEVTANNIKLTASMKMEKNVTLDHKGGEWFFGDEIKVGGVLIFNWLEGSIIDQTYQAGGLKFNIAPTATKSLEFVVDQHTTKGNLDISTKLPIKVGTPKKFVTLKVEDKLNITASELEIPQGMLIAEKGGNIDISGAINIHPSTETANVNFSVADYLGRQTIELKRGFRKKKYAVDALILPSSKLTTEGDSSENQFTNAILSGGDLSIKTGKPFTTQGMELYVSGDFLLKAPTLDLTGDCEWTVENNATLETQSSQFRVKFQYNAGGVQFPFADWPTAHDSYATTGASVRATTGPNTFYIGKKLITTGTTYVLGSQVYYAEAFEGKKAVVEDLIEYIEFIKSYLGGHRKRRKAWWEHVKVRFTGNTIPGVFSIGGEFKSREGVYKFSANITVAGDIELEMIEDLTLGVQTTLKLPPPKVFSSKIPLMDPRFVKKTSMFRIVEEQNPTIFRSLLSIPIESETVPIIVLDKSGALRFNTKNLRPVLHPLQERKAIIHAFMESFSRGFLSEKITKPAEILKTLKENAQKYLTTVDTMALTKGVEAINEPMIVYEEVEIEFPSNKKEIGLVPTLYVPRSWMDIQLLSGAGCLMSYAGAITITGNKEIVSRVLLNGFIKTPKKLIVDVNLPNFERRTTKENVTVYDETISRSMMGKKKKVTKREFEIDVPEPGCGIIAGEGVEIRNADHWRISSLDIDAGTGDIVTTNVNLITEEAVIGGKVERTQDKLRNPLGSVTTIEHEVVPVVRPSRFKTKGKVKLVSQVGLYGAIEIQGDAKIEAKQLALNIIQPAIERQKQLRNEQIKALKKVAKKKQNKKMAWSVAGTIVGAAAGLWAAAQYAASASAAAASASAAASSATTSAAASAAAAKTAAAIALKAAVIKGVTASTISALITQQNPLEAAAKGALFAGIGHEVGSAFSEFDNVLIKEGVPIATSAAVRSIVDRTPLVESIVSTLAGHAVAGTVLPEKSNEIIQFDSRVIQSSILHGFIVESVSTAVKGLSIQAILQAGVMGAIYSLANQAGEELAKTALKEDSQSQQPKQESEQKQKQEQEIKESIIEEAATEIVKELENKNIPVSKETIRKTLESQEALQGSIAEVQNKLAELGDPKGKATSRESAIKRGFNKVLAATFNALFPAVYAAETSHMTDHIEIPQNSDSGERKRFSLPSVFPENEKNDILRPIYAVGRGIEIGRDATVDALIHPIETTLNLLTTIGDGYMAIGDLFGLSTESARARNLARGLAVNKGIERFAQGDLATKVEMTSQFATLGILGGATGSAPRGFISELRALTGSAIKSSHGFLFQEFSFKATGVKTAAKNGAPLHRVAKTSERAADGRYWATENPLHNAEYIVDYAVPLDNLPFLFSAEGQLKSGAKIITRTAEGGTAIEVVVSCKDSLCKITTREIPSHAPINNPSGKMVSINDLQKSWFNNAAEPILGGLVNQSMSVLSQAPRKIFDISMNGLIPTAHATEYSSDSGKREPLEKTNTFMPKTTPFIFEDECLRMANQERSNIRNAGYAGIAVGAAGLTALTGGAALGPATASAIGLAGMVDFMSDRVAESTLKSCRASYDLEPVTHDFTESSSSFSVPSVLPPDKDQTLDKIYSVGRAIEKTRDMTVDAALHPVRSVNRLLTTVWDGYNSLADVTLGVSTESSMQRNARRGEHVVGLGEEFVHGSASTRIEMTTMLALALATQSLSTSATDLPVLIAGFTPKLWTKSARIKAAGLPNSGSIRYVPPKDYDPSYPLPRERGGFVDNKGNIWQKGPARGKQRDKDFSSQNDAYEWDVQLSKEGRRQLGGIGVNNGYTNVSKRGWITH